MESLTHGLLMPMGTNCAVHTHRSQVPVEHHHIWPIGLGGPNAPANRVDVCCNGHYSIHAFIELLIKHDGAVPADASRRFGAKVKRLARQGWTEAGKPVHGGGE